jgi:hypothetical protein
MSLLSSLRAERLPRRPAFALVAVAVSVVVGEFLVARALNRAVDGSGFPVWLPEFGSVGATAVVYAQLFDLLQFVVIPVLLVWFGYELGRRRETTPAGVDREMSPRS